jgi:homoserine kinase
MQRNTSNPCCYLLLLLQVPFKSMINNSCQGGSLVAAILTGNAQLLGAALDSDAIVEPVRAPLIPGMMEVKAAAKAAGGCCGRGGGIEC